MHIESCEGIWLEIAPELRERLGNDRFGRWLEPLRVLNATENELRMGAPNTFWLEWVEKEYLKDVEEVLARRTGHSMRLSLSIDPELFQQMRRSQRKILAGTPRPRDRGEFPLEAARDPDPSDKLGGSGRYATEQQTLDNFVVGPSNQLGYTAALQMVETPAERYNPFFLHGACGLGKTHLLRGIWRALRRRNPRDQIRFLTGEEFLNQFVTSCREKNTGRFRERYRTSQMLVIDDIHLLGNKQKTQEEFLHTFNALVDAGHQIVMSSNVHPKEIGKLQDSLVGRFLSGMVAKVGRPEFETRFKILSRKATDSRVPFCQKVLHLVAERIRSNIRELIGAFRFLEEVSAQEGRRLEVEEARDLIQESLPRENRRLTLSQITARVGQHFGISPDLLVSASRRRSLTTARQVAMYLCRKYTPHSLAEIGQFFGDRNHTSVKSAESKVEGLRQTNPVLARDIETIIDSFEE